MKNEDQIIDDCIMLVEQIEIFHDNIDEEFANGMEQMKEIILQRLKNKQKIDKMRYD